MSRKTEWYTNTKPGDSQGMVIDENGGRDVAVTYDPKDAALVAAAPALLAALQTLVEKREDKGLKFGPYPEWYAARALVSMLNREMEEAAK